MSELKRFFEFFPLYTAFDRGHKMDSLDIFMNSLPSLNLFCKKCDDSRTFVFQDLRPPTGKAITAHQSSGGEIVGGKTFQISYRCADCKSEKYIFAVEFDLRGRAIHKFGQSPALDTSGDKQLTKKLGTYSNLYRKGLVCESQSYGIGAYAYYRRIIEAIIGTLISEIEQLVDKDQKQTFKDIIAQIKTSHSAAERIELVKDHLPSSLRPSGHNPLGLLYGLISEGLHSESDDTCLEQAIHIRESLEEFIHLLDSQGKAKKALEEKTKALLELKARKGTS